MDNSSFEKSLQGNSAEVLRFKVVNAICISAYARNIAKGWAVVVPIKELTADRLSSEVARIERCVKASMKECDVKVVGQRHGLDRTLGFMQSLGIDIKAKESRDSFSMDVIFDCMSGRLRVSVDQKSEPVRVKTEKKKIKVLVVDDSLTIQRLLSGILGADPDIHVVGVATKPSQVEGLIVRHKPDVITLDIHMPEMDGVALLKELMPRYKIPTIMITSLSIEEGSKVLDAFENGAVDYIQKPSTQSLRTAGPQVIERVKIAAQAKVFQGSSQAVNRHRNLKKEIDESIVIAIGSSTGGTEALREVLTRLPDHIPPILIVQHIPPVFSRAFADRLNGLCEFQIKEAEDGDEVKPDRVLIAPGGKHMTVKKINNVLKVVIEETELYNRHRPSADLLFNSVANCIGNKAVGVILTGMGNDGAEGLLKMKVSGARTLAQDEATSVVYGMPKEAVRLGAAEPTNLLKIPEILTDWFTVSKSRKKSAAF